MADLEIHQFMCRSDNFGVLLHDPESGQTASIDAPEQAPIEAALKEKGWKLSHILTTHHHGDHVEANEALKKSYGVEIVGPKAEADRIPGIDRKVDGGDAFEFAGHRIEVISTPGHTAGHVSYYLPDDSLLFAADTLFALGCGRIFEGSPEMMWNSLKKLRALPDRTIVYCGHEYTLANARFAVTVDPENLSLTTRASDVEVLREAGNPTLPTTIGVEKMTNPFFRPDDPAIRKHLGMENASDAEVFAEIRSRKDRF